MSLLFYSTKYAPERAQAEIRKLLRQIGARSVTEHYNSERRQVDGMSFSLATAQGERDFMLPVRTERVLAVLRKQGVLRGSGQRGDPSVQQQHAESVSWRTLLEWLKVQAALIETDQVQAPEIMLPYLMLTDEVGRTVSLYEQFSGQAMLPSGV